MTTLIDRLRERVKHLGLNHLLNPALWADADGIRSVVNMLPNKHKSEFEALDFNIDQAAPSSVVADLIEVSGPSTRVSEKLGCFCSIGVLSAYAIEENPNNITEIYLSASTVKSLHQQLTTMLNEVEEQQRIKDLRVQRASRV